MSTCLHHMPAYWKVDGVDKRGHARIVCKECGRFIGYREPEKPATVTKRGQ